MQVSLGFAKVFRQCFKSTISPNFFTAKLFLLYSNLIHQYNPDVIVGTESWLKPTIYPPVRYFHQAMKYLEEIGQMAMGVSS